MNEPQYGGLIDKHTFKIIIILSLFIILISFVSAVDMICLNPVPQNTTCLMVTPVITCSIYTYELYNENSSLLDSGLMSNFLNDTYYFNFTEDVGTYYVKICDGSTRQIIVQGDTMIGLTGQTWIIITLILLFILFLWLSFKVDPLFMTLDGIIFVYFAYYGYTIYTSWFLTVVLSMVGLLFIIVSVMAKIGQTTE